MAQGRVQWGSYASGFCCHSVCKLSSVLDSGSSTLQMTLFTLRALNIAVCLK